MHHSSISPRIRRLDSTRDVRHGSVVIQRNEALTSMDPSRDPLNKVHEEGLFLNLTSRTNDTITVEWTYCHSQSWMPIDHFLLEHSSVTNPDFINVKLASNERQYVLRNCEAGTNNFFVISTIDVYGKVIIRSKQLTVQASAPIDRPTLKLKKNSPDCITFEWSRPTEYGDGFISEYHLKVDGKFYTNARSTKTSFEFVECRPLENYTFRIQALSIKHDCNSEWSNVLEVACPAALPITLQRLRPKTVDTAKVGWNLPYCKGGARVKEFKVYFKEATTCELYNDQVLPDPDKIFGHRHAIVRSFKQDESECSIKVDPKKNYWAILKAEIIPEGCPAVITSPVRVRATLRPVAPQITLKVYGQDERMETDKEIAELLDKRDKIKRHKEILQSNDTVVGAQLKNDEMQDMNVMLYRIEKRLQELIIIVNKITGFVPVLLKWEKPEFDEFSEPASYRINIDDNIYHNHFPILALDCTEHPLKLDVEKDNHTVSVTTTSSHPVGDSAQSNVEVVSTKEFRPNRFFCYFRSHNKAASWPSSGGCCLEDFLAYEKKLTCKKIVQRGLLKTRLLPKPFKVIGIHDDMHQLLIRHFSRKSTIILFWTKWCVSSQNMLEHFSNFAHQSKDKYVYLSCCVESGEDKFSHRKSVIELLNGKKLRVHGNIRHCCACHTSPDFTAEKTENASIPITFDLDGVPTFFILDNKGRLAWKGRVAADSDNTFSNYMIHVMSQVDEQKCPTSECQHCKDEEEGLTYEPKEMTEENNGHCHEEAEEKHGEENAKVSLHSQRKEWLEKRRANAKAMASLQSPTEPNNAASMVPNNASNARGIETRGDSAAHDHFNGNRTPMTRNKSIGDIKNYPHRQPDRDYRSPNNGYDKPRYGYGSGNTLTNNSSRAEAPPQELNLGDNKEKPRSSGYRHSDINYHASERIETGDQEGENARKDREENIGSNKGMSLGYQSSKDSPTGWNSSIKTNNISRDTSRTDPLSSTWPARSGFEHQEEEVHEFMKPSHLRGTKDKNGSDCLCPEISGSGVLYNSTPNLRKQNVNSHTYTYVRPSALPRGGTAPAKSTKKKEKFSHIQSRYSVASYKPEKANLRGVVSANKRSVQSSAAGRKTASHRHHTSRDEYYGRQYFG